MRIGIDDDHLTFLDAGRLAADAGAAAVALHARTAEQRYSGHADWTAIAELVEALPGIPVLGNGDIWAADDAVAMVERPAATASSSAGAASAGRGSSGSSRRRSPAARSPAPPLGEVAATAPSTSSCWSTPSARARACA